MKTDLKIGYSCNNNCIYCAVASDKKQLVSQGLSVDLSTKECESRIDTSIKNGSEIIILTGGEPTIRLDFFGILKYIKKYNKHIILQTNARAMSSRSFTKQVANIGILNALVSCQSNKAKIHDLLTGVKGSFRETIQGIKNMVYYGIPIIINTVFTKINKDTLCDTVSFFHSLGVNRVNYGYIDIVGNACENIDKVLLNFSEVKRIANNIMKESKKINIQVSFSQLPLCVIHDSGKIARNDNVKMLAVQAKKPKQLLFGFNNYAKICNSCKCKEMCYGIDQKYIAMFGENGIKPITI